jgi:Ca-activated chloride channel family protein
MNFAHPQLFWLLLVPFAVLAWELTRARRTAALSQPKILRAEAGADTLELSALNSQLSTPRRTRPRVWLFLGLALAVLALTRPQYGRLDEPVFDQSREILLAVDLSRSMLTPDVKPSRLERAKLLITSLLERLAGERLGLVVFSGTAFLQSPLSADYEILREFLPNLGPDYLPEGGTNYTALIQTALGAFKQSGSADRFLIILSDGEATDDTWKSAAAELKKQNIRVLALGIGTAAGAMIPDGQNGFVKDDRGAVVLSKLEPNTLRELADVTGGVYRDASTWVDLASLIQSTVEAGQKGEFIEKNSVRLVERFQWPLAAALLFLVLSFWREFPVRPKPRTLGRPRPPGAPSAPPVISAPRAATLLCVLLLPALNSPLSAQITRTAPAAKTAPPETPPPAPPPSAALSKIVGRLAGTPERSGRDWAELARETVTWGQRLQSEQQPVAPGPVQDALAAVDAGSALDPKTADWPKLREELTALLKKPDDQKQDPQNKDQDKKDQQNQDGQSDPNQKKEQKDKDKSSEKSDPSQQKNDPNQKPDDQNQSKDSPDNPDSKPNEGKQGQKAFGDMKDQPPPPPPPEGDTQQVGGNPDKKPADASADPSLAMPLQKLDQLRNQDSPAKLFKLMQGDPKPTPAKKGKNW